MSQEPATTSNPGAVSPIIVLDDDDETLANASSQLSLSPASRASHPRVLRTIDEIDLEQLEKLQADIGKLCSQFDCDAVHFNQHDLLKDLDVEYIQRKIIKDKQLWHVILDKYSALALAFPELRHDSRYQYRAINMLAHFINHQCLQYNEFTSQKDKTTVHECCKQIFTLMRVILFDSVEHNVMVLLKTEMVPKNAYLLIVLCKRINRQIERDLTETRPRIHKMSVVMINGVLLLFNMWRQLMPPKELDSFTEERDAVLKRLEAMRLRMRPDNCPTISNFYLRFKISFKTESIRRLVERPVNKSVIDKFFWACVKYWKSVGQKPIRQHMSAPLIVDDDEVIEIDDTEPHQSTMESTVLDKSSAGTVLSHKSQDSNKIVDLDVNCTQTNTVDLTEDSVVIADESQESDGSNSLRNAARDAIAKSSSNEKEINDVEVSETIDEIDSELVVEMPSSVLPTSDKDCPFETQESLFEKQSPTNYIQSPRHMSVSPLESDEVVVPGCENTTDLTERYSDKSTTICNGNSLTCDLVLPDCLDNSSENSFSMKSPSASLQQSIPLENRFEITLCTKSIAEEPLYVDKTVNSAMICLKTFNEPSVLTDIDRISDNEPVTKNSFDSSLPSQLPFDNNLSSSLKQSMAPLCDVETHENRLEVTLCSKTTLTKTDDDQNSSAVDSGSSTDIEMSNFSETLSTASLNMSNNNSYLDVPSVILSRSETKEEALKIGSDNDEKSLNVDILGEDPSDVDKTIDSAMIGFKLNEQPVFMDIDHISGIEPDNLDDAKRPNASQFDVSLRPKDHSNTLVTMNTTYLPETDEDLTLTCSETSTGNLQSDATKSTCEWGVNTTEALNFDTDSTDTIRSQGLKVQRNEQTQEPELPKIVDSSVNVLKINSEDPTPSFHSNSSSVSKLDSGFLVACEENQSPNHALDLFRESSVRQNNQTDILSNDNVPADSDKRIKCLNALPSQISNNFVEECKQMEAEARSNLNASVKQVTSKDHSVGSHNLSQSCIPASSLEMSTPLMLSTCSSPVATSNSIEVKTSETRSKDILFQNNSSSVPNSESRTSNVFQDEPSSDQEVNSEHLQDKRDTRAILPNNTFANSLLANFLPEMVFQNENTIERKSDSTSILAIDISPKSTQSETIKIESSSCTESTNANLYSPTYANLGDPKVPSVISPPTPPTSTKSDHEIESNINSQPKSISPTIMSNNSIESLEPKSPLVSQSNQIESSCSIVRSVQNNLVSSSTIDTIHCKNSIQTSFDSNTPNIIEPDSSIQSQSFDDSMEESSMSPIDQTPPNAICLDVSSADIVKTSASDKSFDYSSIEVKISYGRVELDISNTLQALRNKSAVKIELRSIIDPVKDEDRKRERETDILERIMSEEDFSGSDEERSTRNRSNRQPDMGGRGTPLVDETDCIEETSPTKPIQSFLPNGTVYGKIRTDNVNTLLEKPKVPLLPTPIEFNKQTVHVRAQDHDSERYEQTRTKQRHGNHKRHRHSHGREARSHDRDERSHSHDQDKRSHDREKRSHDREQSRDREKRSHNQDKRSRDHKNRRSHDRRDRSHERDERPSNHSRPRSRSRTVSSEVSRDSRRREQRMSRHRADGSRSPSEKSNKRTRKRDTSDEDRSRSREHVKHRECPRKRRKREQRAAQNLMLSPSRDRLTNNIQTDEHITPVQDVQEPIDDQILDDNKCMLMESYAQEDNSCHNDIQKDIKYNENQGKTDFDFCDAKTDVVADDINCDNSEAVGGKTPPNHDHVSCVVPRESEMTEILADDLPSVQCEVEISSCGNDVPTISKASKPLNSSIDQRESTAAHKEELSVNEQCESSSLSRKENHEYFKRTDNTNTGLNSYENKEESNSYVPELMTFDICEPFNECEVETTPLTGDLIKSVEDSPLITFMSENVLPIDTNVSKPIPVAIPEQEKETSFLANCVSECSSHEPAKRLSITVESEQPKSLFDSILCDEGVCTNDVIKIPPLDVSSSIAPAAKHPSTKSNSVQPMSELINTNDNALKESNAMLVSTYISPASEVNVQTLLEDILDDISIIDNNFPEASVGKSMDSNVALFVGPTLESHLQNIELNHLSQTDEILNSLSPSSVSQNTEDSSNYASTSPQTDELPNVHIKDEPMDRKSPSILKLCVKPINRLKRNEFPARRLSISRAVRLKPVCYATSTRVNRFCKDLPKTIPVSVRLKRLNLSDPSIYIVARSSSTSSMTKPTALISSIKTEFDSAYESSNSGDPSDPLLTTIKPDFTECQTASSSATPASQDDDNYKSVTYYLNEIKNHRSQRTQLSPEQEQERLDNFHNVLKKHAKLPESPNTINSPLRAPFESIAATSSESMSNSLKVSDKTKESISSSPKCLANKPVAQNITTNKAPETSDPITSLPEYPLHLLKTISNDKIINGPMPENILNSLSERSDTKTTNSFENLASDANLPAYPLNLLTPINHNEFVETTLPEVGEQSSDSGAVSLIGNLPSEAPVSLSSVDPSSKIRPKPLTELLANTDVDVEGQSKPPTPLKSILRKTKSDKPKRKLRFLFDLPEETDQLSTNENSKQKDEIPVNLPEEFTPSPPLSNDKHHQVPLSVELFDMPQITDKLKSQIEVSKELPEVMDPSLQTANEKPKQITLTTEVLDPPHTTDPNPKLQHVPYPVEEFKTSQSTDMIYSSGMLDFYQSTLPDDILNTSTNSTLDRIIGPLTSDDIQLNTQFAAKPIDPKPSLVTNYNTSQNTESMFSLRPSANKKRFLPLISLIQPACKMVKLNPGIWDSEIEIFEKYFILLQNSSCHISSRIAQQELHSGLPNKAQPSVMHALNRLQIYFLRRTVTWFRNCKFSALLVGRMEKAMSISCKTPTREQISQLEAKYDELKQLYEQNLSELKICVSDEASLTNAIERTDEFLKEWKKVRESYEPTLMLPPRLPVSSEWSHEIKTFVSHYNKLSDIKTEFALKLAQKVLPVELPRKNYKEVMHAMHGLQICFLRRTINWFRESKFSLSLIDYMEKVMHNCEYQNAPVTFEQMTAIKAKYADLKRSFKNSIIKGKISDIVKNRLDHVIQHTDSFLKEWKKSMLSIFPTQSCEPPVVVVPPIPTTVSAVRPQRNTPTTTVLQTNTALTDTHIADTLVDDLLAENQTDTSDSFVPSFDKQDEFMSTANVNQDYNELMREFESYVLGIDDQPECDQHGRQSSRNDSMISGGVSTPDLLLTSQMHRPEVSAVPQIYVGNPGSDKNEDWIKYFAEAD